MSIRSDADPFKNGRFYHLPTYHRSLDSWSDWDRMSGGLRQSPLTRGQLSSALAKARGADYRAVVLPANSVLHEDFQTFFEQCQFQNLQPIYQVPASWLHRIWATQKEFFESQVGMGFEIILDDIPSDTSLMESVQKKFPTHFTIPGLRSAPVWRKLKSIPYSCYSDLHFYFPYYGDKKKLYKPSQVMELFSEIKRIHPQAVLKSPLGVDVFEPRIEKSQDLEPLLPPIFRRPAPDVPKISVVIPAFNNGRYLINVLKHLNEQDFDKSRYEIIVVDDGSEDETSELVLKWAQSYEGPLTILYYPRLKKRSMGDAQFRAGLGRNLGVKWASGDLLVFLDSDIIVPKNFLSRTWELHRSHDVVQWRRDYLKKDVDSFDMEYEKVSDKRDCFIPEDGYWHKFYSEAGAKQWSAVTDHWKYVCTYALSLSRQQFKDLGWFRKTYCFYGFEDTDLGLRLRDAKAKFHFQNEPVYHLFHETSRSEYQNSTVLRQKLLKNTVRIFFHNNLSPDIYRVFKYLLKEYF